MALIGTTGGETWPPVIKREGDPTVKQYDVEINGMQTTLQLSDEDAKQRGLKPAASKAKANDGADDADSKQAAAPANKAGKQPSNKQAEAAGEAFGQSQG